MISRTVPLCLAAALLAAGSVPAQQRPVASAPAAASDLAQRDARLGAAVTLRLKRSPLSKVVAAIGRQARVSLRASPDVANEPAIVYADAQPAGAVMENLAALFDYRWRRSGTAGRYRYELFQDRPSQKREEALRLAERRRLFQAAEEALRKDTRPTPNGRTDGPWGDNAMMYLLRKELLARLTASARETLLRGDTLRFSTRRDPGTLPLPAALLSRIVPLQQQHVRTARRIPAPSAEELNGRVAAVGGAEALSARVWAETHLSSTVSRTWIGCSARLEGAGLEQQMDYTLTGFGSSSLEVERPVRKATADEAQAWSRDPLLAAAAPFRCDAAAVPAGARKAPGARIRLSDVLPQIAEAYHLNLVADAYRDQRPVEPPAAGEVPLYQLLEKCALPAARWSTHGGFLRVRSDSWYIDRLSELPDPQIRAWAARLREQGRLSLADAMTLVVSLRPEQLAQFRPALEERGVNLSTFEQELCDEGNREMLCALASLTPAQRSALENGDAVPYAALGPAARYWIAASAEQRARRFNQFPAPAPGGELTAWDDEVRRVVSPAPGLDGMLLSEYRVVAGPRADERVGGEYVTAGQTPGAEEGGQTTEHVRFLYRYPAGRPLQVDVTLPCAYADPLPPEAQPPPSDPQEPSRRH